MCLPYTSTVEFAGFPCVSGVSSRYSNFLPCPKTYITIGIVKLYIVCKRMCECVCICALWVGTLSRVSSYCPLELSLLSDALCPAPCIEGACRTVLFSPLPPKNFCLSYICDVGFQQPDTVNTFPMHFHVNQHVCCLTRFISDHPHVMRVKTAHSHSFPVTKHTSGQVVCLFSCLTVQH